MAEKADQFEYKKTIEAIFDEASKDVELSAETAWHFLYRSLLWFESVASQTVPHIRETNDLKKKAWLDRAKRLTTYLDDNLRPSSMDLLERVDWLYKKRVGEGEPIQRQNITGTGFEVALSILLERLCNVTPLIKPRLENLQGFELAPQRFVQQPDLVLFGHQDFKLLISSKWSLRKDRLGEHLYEANFYRERRPDLYIVFVVNEFDPSRLLHLVRAPEVDRVYHVHLPALLNVHDPFPGQTTIARIDLMGNKPSLYDTYQNLKQNIRDLSELFADIKRVKSKQ
jgi:hypothetical protein